MKVRLLDLSKQENLLVEKAPSELGPEFVLAHDLVFFTDEFFVSVNHEALPYPALMFLTFHAQFHNALVLCLLSSVRKHNVQFHMMLRQALENGVLACYALFETNKDAFYKVNKYDIIEIDKNIKVKAYNWLEKNYKDRSDMIKHMKEYINELFAHAGSPDPSNFHFDRSSSEFYTKFFDSDDILFAKIRLHLVGKTALVFLDLFAKIIKTIPIVSLVDDFSQKIDSFINESIQIENEIKSSHRIARWNKIIIESAKEKAHLGNKKRNNEKLKK